MVETYVHNFMKCYICVCVCINIYIWWEVWGVVIGSDEFMGGGRIEECRWEGDTWREERVGVGCLLVCFCCWWCCWGRT